MPQTESRTSTPLLAGVVFVSTLAAFVALELAGHDTDGLVYLAGPVIAALFLTGALGQTVKAQTAPMQEKLNTVQQQTNGALTGGIERAVHAGISKALPVALAAAQAQPTLPPPPAPSPAGEGPSSSTMPSDFPAAG